MTDPKPLYPRDLHPANLEPHYSRHVSAMTTEQLHEKSDIAEQLAWRDQVIESLQATIAENGKHAQADADLREIDLAAEELDPGHALRIAESERAERRLWKQRCHNVFLKHEEQKARAESAEARVAELEKLFDDAGQGEHNVLALIDHYQSDAFETSKRLDELHQYAGRGDGHETAEEASRCIAGVITQLRADLSKTESAEARVMGLEAQLESDRADYDDARKLLYRQACEFEARAKQAEARLGELDAAILDVEGKEPP